MKTKLFYLIAVLFALHLGVSGAQAQSAGEFMFITYDTKNPAVSVIANVDTIQPVSKNGVRFSVTVKNNTGKAMTVHNIADQLSASLYNNKGFDISCSNRAVHLVDRKETKWQYRSEGVDIDRAYVNGREDKRDVKQQEYVEIPAGGSYKVNLKITCAKVVNNKKDNEEKRCRPAVPVSAGEYGLRLLLSVREKDTKGPPLFHSPRITIHYGVL